MKKKAAFYILKLCRQLFSLERYRRKKGVEVKVHCQTWAFYRKLFINSNLGLRNAKRDLHRIYCTIYKQYSERLLRKR